MNHVPVHLLNAFMVFNDAGNIVRAAQALGITQPALSKQLKSLEQKIAQPLFSLNGRKKVLTPFGRDLHKQIKHRLGGLQEVVNQASLVHAQAAQATVRIAARRGLIDRCCGKIGFQGRLTFLESANDQIIQELLSQNIEIGLLHDVPDSAELIAKPLLKEEFKLVIPKRFLKTKRNYGKALLQDLMAWRCIGYKEPDEILGRLCIAHNLDPRLLKMNRVTASYSNIAEMVGAKLGWAALPAYIEVSSEKNWMIPIPGDVLKLREFFIVYRKEFHQILWFKELVQEVRQSF
jgi:DNA-binding transcriptional LysR family regulator